MKLKEIGHIELENRADKDTRRALVTALMLMGFHVQDDCWIRFFVEEK